MFINNKFSEKGFKNFNAAKTDTTIHSALEDVLSRDISGALSRTGRTGGRRVIPKDVISTGKLTKAEAALEAKRQTHVCA